MDIIQQLNNSNKLNDKVDNKIKIAFEKIKYLIEVYKENNENYYHKIINEIFHIYNDEKKENDKDINENKENEKNNEK